MSLYIKNRSYFAVFVLINSTIIFYTLALHGTTIKTLWRQQNSHSRLSVSRNLMELYKWIDTHASDFTMKKGLVIKKSNVSGLGIFNEQGEVITKGSTIMRISKNAWYPYSGDFSLIMQEKENKDKLDRLKKLNGMKSLNFNEPEYQRLLSFAASITLRLMNSAMTDPDDGYLSFLRKCTESTNSIYLLDRETIFLASNSLIFGVVASKWMLYVEVSEKLFPDSLQDQKMFLKCVGVIFSRVLPAVGNRIALIPVLDIINHSYDHNTYHVMNKSDDSMELIALRDIQIDEEITICYGKEKDSGRYLNTFGFIPDDPSSEIDYLNDYFPITITLPPYVKEILSSLQPLPDTHPLSGFKFLNMNSDFNRGELKVVLWVPLLADEEEDQRFIRLVASYHSVLYHHHYEYTSLSVEKDLLAILQTLRAKKALSMSAVYVNNNNNKWWLDALTKLYAREIDSLDILIGECKKIV